MSELEQQNRALLHRLVQLEGWAHSVAHSLAAPAAPRVAAPTPSWALCAGSAAADPLADAGPGPRSATATAAQAAPPSQAGVLLPASDGPSPDGELAAPSWVDAAWVGAVTAPVVSGAPAAASIAPSPAVPTGASSAAATGASSAASSPASSPAAAPSGASTAAGPEPVGQAPGTDAPTGDTTDAPSTSAPAEGGFEWERWLGVRGAAALGGLALTVAAAYFFRYSLEAGLLGPTARVILGTALGVACIAAAEGPLRRRYRVLGDWLAGAGGAVLYLAFWAASALYGMVPLLAGFAGMAAVTATCALLAVRRRAPAIAILAFLGGFASAGPPGSRRPAPRSSPSA